MSKLVCSRCHTDYSLDQPIWKCHCGGLLDIQMSAFFSKIALTSRKPTMWRYHEAIPVANSAVTVSFDEGFTPLTTATLFDSSVFIKHDHLFPTGSYKDRGASVIISKAAELGITAVVEDSSGNAACSVAAYSAKAGIACDIFVPAHTSSAKLAQILWYGAQLTKVPGSREDTARAVLRAAEHTYYASHSWNPFFFHGTKTIAFEIAEQLNWQAPDAVVLPVGNGTLALGAMIGFEELLQAGFINRIPRIIAVQAAGVAPLAAAFEQHLSEVPAINKGTTLAEGIAIAEPIRGLQIIEAVRKSQGQFVTVTDTQIIGALRMMGRLGFYIEPTAAATVAGLGQFLAQKPSDAVIVVVLTGHGLKNTEKMFAILNSESSHKENPTR